MDLITQMLRIRTVELEIAKRYPEGKMRTPVHLSVGQEAAAVGVCAAMLPGDQAVSTHRAHAHYLAMGGSLNALIAELHGKGTGCSGGYGGSMHLVDRRVGFMGSTSIVGGTIPIGIGLAWAMKHKMDSEGGTVFIFHGDAAVEEGVWHESVNFAVLHNLPVIFVCENNRLSCFTDIAERQPRDTFVHLARAHGLAAIEIDTVDPYNIRHSTINMKPHTPAFIEINTQRFLEHCGPNNDDHLDYRQQYVVDYWRSIDPIKDHVPSPAMLDEIATAFRLADEAAPPKEVPLYAD